MTPIILMLIFLAVTFVYLMWGRTWIRRWRGSRNFKLPSHFPYSGITPFGVSWESVVPVPIEALDEVDAGIGEQIYRHSAKHPDWAVGRRHDEYKVYFVNPMAINVETEPGSPALIMPNGQHTAGTCVGVGHDTSRPPAIVLPHQKPMNWQFTDYLMHSAWHESEHLREFANDPQVFWFFSQPGNDIHPHVP